MAPISSQIICGAKESKIVMYNFHVIQEWIKNIKEPTQGVLF